MQKSRRRTNKIEVIVIVGLCWHGNNFSINNQDQVNSLLNILYTCDYLYISHQYAFQSIDTLTGMKY